MGSISSGQSRLAALSALGRAFLLYLRNAHAFRKAEQGGRSPSCGRTDAGQLGVGRENGKEPRACAWKEPVFSTGTDAERRLPVAACLTEWQAETFAKGSVRRGVSGLAPSITGPVDIHQSEGRCSVQAGRALDAAYRITLPEPCWVIGSDDPPLPSAQVSLR